MMLILMSLSPLYPQPYPIATFVRQYAGPCRYAKMQYHEINPDHSPLPAHTRATLKVTRSINPPIRILIPLQPRPPTFTHPRIRQHAHALPLLSSNTAAFLATIIELLLLTSSSLLLPPQPPRDERQSTDQDCASDTADHTTDNLLRVRGQVIAAPATISETRGDSCGSVAGGGGEDFLSREDGAVDLAVGSPEGGEG